jgi:hypothetical protein
MTTDLKKRENGIVIFERFPSFNCPEPVLVNINQFVSKNVGQKPAGFVLPEGYLKGKWLRLIRVVVVLVGPRRAKPGAPAKKRSFYQDRLGTNIGKALKKDAVFRTCSGRSS